MSEYFLLWLGVWHLTDTEWVGWAPALASMATRQISIIMNIHGIRATRDAAERGDVGNSIAGVCLWLTADGDPESPWPPHRVYLRSVRLYTCSQSNTVSALKLETTGSGEFGQPGSLMRCGMCLSERQVGLTLQTIRVLVHRDLWQ